MASEGCGDNGGISSGATGNRPVSVDVPPPTQFGQPQSGTDGALPEVMAMDSRPPVARQTSRQSSGIMQMVGLATPNNNGTSSAPVSRQELLQRGMSARQADAQIVRQHQEEIIQIQFRRCVICFSFTLLLTYLTAAGLQVWVLVEYFSAEHKECDIPLKTWVIVLFVVWSVRNCGTCVNRCICCWHPPEEEFQPPTPPARVRMKDYFVLVFDFVWVVCIGLHWILSDGNSENDLPACETTVPNLFMACKVYVCFQLANLIWLWISVIGLRNMLRHMIRRGLLQTNDAAPQAAIEKNTEVITLTKEQLEETPACPICMEEYNNEGEAIARSKVCGHVFCQRCLHNWLKTARSCPLCRADLGNLDPPPPSAGECPQATPVGDEAV
mmetsp:Transcript_50152/g.99100  ORF Transcript_50152/g.99100 Transcript_50152/m.99100 type:complete len:384 (-) Transcript_50152:121-1272(-)